MFSDYLSMDLISSTWSGLKSTAWELWQSQDSSQRDQEEFTTSLAGETAVIRSKNQTLEATYLAIKRFIENDPQLLEQFAACYLQTKEILLPSPKQRASRSATNVVVEEWRAELQKAHALQSIMTRIQDFLTKNPAFAALLTDKCYSKQRQSGMQNAILHTLSHEQEILSGFLANLTGNHYDPSLEILPQTNVQKEKSLLVEPVTVVIDHNEMQPALELKLVPAIKRTYYDAAMIFQNVATLIRTDSEILSLFQKYGNPFLLHQGASLIKRPSSRQFSAIVTTQTVEQRAEQTARMQTFLFVFLNAHPQIRSRLINKMQGL